MSELNRIKDRVHKIYKTLGDDLDPIQLTRDLLFVLEENARLRRINSRDRSLILQFKNGLITREQLIESAGLDYGEW